ncbi:sugar-binding transcriptional regulator [Roseibium marinum]|uniref:DNA-binding transcriptional regulator LsrR (DeoR family) n=1 Tax=Roseibium marinum TaxID=281252 RepID=A0A2S3V352_9HYPH|nr:sugar-binding transcriptional regulator [Roseibium marinum]POF34414.1 DNA-binding transcriptional regulator LsrR (DeoR family) [Roseibium marinum]
MQVRDDDWTTHMAIRAAWLSFVGGRTQGEIASQLGVSPAKVHRLIAHAQKAGYVKFQVDGRPMECLKLENELTDRFHLTNCIIAPDLGGGDDDSAVRAVAASGAQFLAALLSGSNLTRLGVGMGRTLTATVEALPKITRPDLEIMSICGSLTRTLAANPYDIIQKMQERTGGVGYYLPVPYFAENRDEKAMFLTQRSVQDLMARAGGSDAFLVGIGSVENEGHLVRRGMISKQEQEELLSVGAVCDLMGRFLTLDGKLAPDTLGDCAVGLHFDEVRGSRVIALVGGESKVDATLAALRTGVITDLVTDETLARALSTRAGLQLAQSA